MSTELFKIYNAVIVPKRQTHRKQQYRLASILT